MQLDDFKDKDGKFIDFYNLLGIPDSADEETIKKAYRAKCLFAHPDGKEEFERSWYEEEFKKINKAKQCLLSREDRKLYDAYRAKVLRIQQRTRERMHRQQQIHTERPVETEPPRDFTTNAIYSFTATDLYQAAKNGDIEQVKKQLARGTDINQRAEHYHRETPLHAASFEGHREIAELLLSRGADVNRKDRRGLTPLHLAVQECRRDVVELLIARGADVNARDSEGYRPLHLVSSLQKGCEYRKETAELLIAAGADVNAGDNFLGDTPLHTAAGNGHAEIVEILIRRGAGLHIENKIGRTPFEAAQRYNRTEVLRILENAAGR